MTRTNAYTLLCVAIRAIAVYVATMLVLAVPATYFSLRRGLDGADSAAPMLAPLLLMLFVAAALWLFADRIARLALSRPGEAAFDSSLEPRAWLGLAVSAIGAWYLFNGLLDLAYLATKAILVARQAPTPYEEEALASLLPDAVAGVLQLILAATFLLQGPALARWVERMRYGTPGTLDGDAR